MGFPLSHLIGYKTAKNLGARQMKRRTFLAGSASLLAAPHIARARGTKPPKRLAIIRNTGPVSYMTPNGSIYFKGFFEELANLGYVEGQTLTVFRF
jgi:hypothetical protein